MTVYSDNILNRLRSDDIKDLLAATQANAPNANIPQTAPLPAATVPKVPQSATLPAANVPTAPLPAVPVQTLPPLAAASAVNAGGAVSLPESILATVQANFDTTSGGYLLGMVTLLLILYSTLHYCINIRKSLYRRGNKTRVLPSSQGYKQFDAEEEKQYPLMLKESSISKFMGSLGRRVPFTHTPLIDLLVLMFYAGLSAASVYLFGQNTSLGRALGYITGANAILTVLTGLKNSLLMWLLQIPFDRTIAIHRLMGYLAYVVVTGHGAYYMINLTPDTIVSFFQGSQKNFNGLVSWGAVTLLIIFSFAYFRRKHYNMFYRFHIVFFLGFFYFGYKHTKYFFNYSAAFVVLYGIDRLIRMANGLFPRKTTLLEHIYGDAVKIRFPKSPLKNYRVGQYVFINFPGIKLLEWHPFTLSSSPTDPYCEVVIRGLGVFTKSLVEFSKFNPNQQLFIRVDGPYGKWPFDIKRYRTVILVAGGVGVTPCIAMIRELFNSQMEDNFGNVEKVHLIWSCQDSTTLTWFSKHFEQSVFGTRNQLEFKKDIYLTRETNPNFFEEGVSLGRPDIDAIFESINRAVEYDSIERVAVIACGPSPLVNATWDATTRLSTGKTHYDFHHETFDF
jgi:predicted ferric reductase